MAKFDVYAMCNALMDIQAQVPEALLIELGYAKGAMSLVDAEEQLTLVATIADHVVSRSAGGSGANTAIGVAQLGGTAAYTSHVGDDGIAADYRAGLEALGVRANLGQSSGATGTSLVVTTPDSDRTMFTFLGRALWLAPEDVALDDLDQSQVLYVTGYLWDTETQKRTVLHAMDAAKAKGVKVALSLSDPFCVNRHREAFAQLLEQRVDIVMGNEEEAVAMTGLADPFAAAHKLAESCETVAVTLGPNGSIAVQGREEVHAEAPRIQAVDTTGAGDLYAAGFLYGLTHDLGLKRTADLATRLAAQVVAQHGPRLDSIDRGSLGI